MSATTSSIVQEAIDVAIGERGEIGVQVAAYLDSELVIDQWGRPGRRDHRPRGRRRHPFPGLLQCQGSDGDGPAHPGGTGSRGLLPAGGQVLAGIRQARQGQGHRLRRPDSPHRGSPDACRSDAGADVRLGLDGGAVGRHASPVRAGHAQRLHWPTLLAGWVGEVVRRTDPQHRPVGQFIQEEICQPLGIDALWAGIPAKVEPRVAKLTNIPPLPPGAPGMPPDSLRPRATPPEVATTQEVFGRSDVRAACIPGAQGIMNARSQARFYAMLANGGELDGVRLLSEHRVRTFHVPRPPSDYDPVSGTPHNGTIGGFHFAGSPGWAPWATTPWPSDTTAPAARWAGPTRRTGWRLQSSTTAWWPMARLRRAAYAHWHGGPQGPWAYRSSRRDVA